MPRGFSYTMPTYYRTRGHRIPIYATLLPRYFTGRERHEQDSGTPTNATQPCTTIGNHAAREGGADLSM